MRSYASPLKRHYALLRGGVLSGPMVKRGIEKLGREGFEHLVYIVAQYCVVLITLNAFDVLAGDSSPLESDEVCSSLSAGISSENGPSYHGFRMPPSRDGENGRANVDGIHAIGNA